MSLHIPNSPWGGNNDVIYNLFPPRESLVSDIPGRGREYRKDFFTVCILIYEAMEALEKEKDFHKPVMPLL
jgi:hypothetical protein